MLSLVAQRKADEIDDQLLLLEHAPVITLGRTADPKHLLSNPFN
jgi:lipoate-protein ligase B